MTANGKARFGDDYKDPLALPGYLKLNERAESRPVIPIMTKDNAHLIDPRIEPKNNLQPFIPPAEDVEPDRIIDPEMQAFLDDFNAKTLAERNESGTDEFLTSLLEPQETSSPICPITTYRGRFMAGKEDEYTSTMEAYTVMYDSPTNGHRMALSDCRRYATFSREKTSGDVRVMTNSCRDRWCPMCAEQKAKYAKDSSEIYIKSLKVPRFLTLTLKNNGNSLQEQIDFLQSSFRRIRQRAYWKKNVTGGIWFLQVKRGHNSGCWHPHLHILLDGNYMEQGKLSELWELVTFGSPVIDIRKIHDPESAAKYVARYTARPAMLSEMSVDDRVEVIDALFRKRLSGTFGTGKTVTLTPPKIEDGCEWQDVGLYDSIVRDAAINPAAQAVIDCWSENYPLTEERYEDYTGHPVHYVVPDYTQEKPVQFLLDFYNT